MVAMLLASSFSCNRCMIVTRICAHFTLHGFNCNVGDERGDWIRREVARLP